MGFHNKYIELIILIINYRNPMFSSITLICKDHTKRKFLPQILSTKNVTVQPMSPGRPFQGIGE